ncbi:hypothetical protein JXB31_05085 [Candidatus Woesearchaeota archaeon]|nr:hypothetical protein [Candidatus Woesearchaeota archaeon]
MDDANLEIVVKERIKPYLDRVTEEIIGVNINKLTDDITSRLDSMSILDLDIDYKASYKGAKKRFRKSYLTRLLLLNLGNISEAAKIAGIDRRSMHRMITGFGIDVGKIKKELQRPYSLKVDTLSHLIEDVLDNYKQLLHPGKLKNIYLKVGKISQDIAKELPELSISLKDAEKRFERLFLRHAIESNSNNISKAARMIGLRQETLHRKINALGIKAHL